MKSMMNQGAGMMSQGGMQDGTDDQSGQTDDQSQEPSGYVILLHVAGDGSISVGVESEAEEAQEGETPGDGSEAAEQASGDNDDQMKPCANIKEALTEALAIYKADGQMPDDTSADEAFQQGLSGKGY